MAGDGGSPVCPDAQGLAAVIRIDAAWLATAPLDMRAGTDTARRIRFLTKRLEIAEIVEPAYASGEPILNRGQ